MVASGEEATIEAIAGCCARIEGMCAALGEVQWHQPTALPAWDLQDVVAHLGSLEAMLLGRDEPLHQAAATAHVRNALGAMNERMVDRRRSWTGAAVLDEFRETTALRLDELRRMDGAELERQVPSPAGGTVPQRAFLGIRLWDYVVHEMDIAEALGLPVDLQTTAARRVLDEMLLLVPRAVAKAGAGEASVTALVLDEPLPRSLSVRVEHGRAVAVDPAAAGEATLHLRASPATFLRVGAGRRDPGHAIAVGDIAVSGDVALAGRVMVALNVVP